MNGFLGADYMANFSPVSWAEISARLPEQIFLKRRLRLHEESFSPVKRAEKPHVIAFKFQPRLKYELEHAYLFSCTRKKHVKCFPANPAPPLPQF